MHRLAIAATALGLLTGCLATAEDYYEDRCDRICGNLVHDCQIGAYPTFSSCIEGCMYEAQQGLVDEDKVSCITGAECDPMGIIECENGPSAD